MQQYPGHVTWYGTSGGDWGSGRACGRAGQHLVKVQRLRYLPQRMPPKIAPLGTYLSGTQRVVNFG